MAHIDGFYSMSYTGAAGSGFGLIVLFRNLIAGSDVAGATYDGTFENEGAEYFNIRVKMKAPVGAWLVQTGVQLTSPLELPIGLTVKADFASGEPILAETPLGPVNVAFRKLREFPENFRVR
jgi:hypothetical protein